MMLIYVFIALVFQVMIDYAARIAKRYVPFSASLNVLAGLCGIGGAAACLFGMENGFFVRTGTGLLIGCFVLLHLKYIFAGANLLGGRFIPNAVRFLDDRMSSMPRSSSSDSGFL
jgi:hypothetical protein